jgi:hypothetical protein
VTLACYRHHQPEPRRTEGIHIGRIPVGLEYAKAHEVLEPIASLIPGDSDDVVRIDSVWDQLASE